MRIIGGLLRKVATSWKSIADGEIIVKSEVCGELGINRERDLGLCSSFKSEIPLQKKILMTEKFVS